MTHRTSKIFVTVDTIVFKNLESKTEILLIKRGNDPFKDMWAIPGGFVDENEDLKTAAERELSEETGLKNIELHQLAAIGTPGRDPRGHMVSVCYWGICSKDCIATGADDAKEAQWFPIYSLPKLAFDHADIIALALEKSKI